MAVSFCWENVELRSVITKENIHKML